MGILPFFSTSRATFVLKPGALTQISTVCPARNFRCFLLSDEITVDALFLTLPAFSDFDLNGHFFPLHLIVAFQPFGNCCVI